MQTAQIRPLLVDRGREHVSEELCPDEVGAVLVAVSSKLKRQARTDASVPIATRAVATCTGWRRSEIRSAPVGSVYGLLEARPPSPGTLPWRRGAPSSR